MRQEPKLPESSWTLKSLHSTGMVALRNCKCNLSSPWHRKVQIHG